MRTTTRRSALVMVSLSIAAVASFVGDLGCRQPPPNKKDEDGSTRRVEALRATFPNVLGRTSELHLVTGDGDLAVGEATHIRLLDSTKSSVWRTTRYSGVEDFVAIPTANDDSGSLDYVITLGDWTKGLRLVERTLELLDRNGVPRLRMVAPYLVDQHESVRNIEVAVKGCAVDTNPLPPFGRSFEAPPAGNQCILHVSWQRGDLTYPVLVDPGWSKTTSMATARYRHNSHKLPNGDVLVTGGLTFVADKEVATAAAEIYSATNGVWTTTSSMMHPRAFAGDSTLANGDVLMTGGYDQTLSGQTIHPSCEIYAVATGMWSKTTGDLITPRAGHTAGELGDGSVLIAGGFDNSGEHFTTTEIFMPATSSFVSAGNINNTRYFQAGVVLGTGKVLLSGGSDPQAGPLGTLELFTKGVGWSPAASLPTMTRRNFHAMVTLPNGDAMIAGGYNPIDGDLATAEIYHTATNTIEKLPDTLAKSRYELVGATLSSPGGKVLFIGGQGRTGHFADGEIYDPVGQPSFLRVRGLSDERALGHKATVLNDGRVLVNGGYEPHYNRSLATADIFDITADAGPYLPDEEDRPPDLPDATPHGGNPDACVWPCVGDGRPSGDASASSSDAGTQNPPQTNTESTEGSAFSPLTGSGSGCSVVAVTNNDDHPRAAALMMMIGSLATALGMFTRRRRRRRRR